MISSPLRSPLTNALRSAFGPMLSAGSGDLSLDFRTGQLPAGLTFSRSSNAWMFGADGKYVAAPNNSLLWSNDVSNAVWGVTAATKITGGFREDTTNSQHTLGVGLLTQVGQLYHWSIECKRGAGSRHLQLLVSGAIHANGYVNFDLDSGTVAIKQAGILSASCVPGSETGYYRCTIEFVAEGTFPGNAFAIMAPTTAHTRVPGYTGDGVSSLLVQKASAGPGPFRGYFETTTVAYYGPRFEHDPTQFVHNAVPNSQGVGGTATTLPTGWVVSLGTTTGITTSQVGGGVDPATGAIYVDWRVQGTATATFYPVFRPYTSNAPVAAVPGQTWTTQFKWKLIAGSINVAGHTVSVQTIGTNSGAYVEGFQTNLTGTEGFTTNTRTLTNAATNAVLGYVSASLTTGTTVDYTLRLWMPQLEQARQAGPYIPTTGTPSAILPYMGGLLMEDQRTNAVPNSMGVGGTASALPTGWSFAQPAGITPSVVGSGTLPNGLPYWDCRFVGTSAIVGACRINFTASVTSIPANNSSLANWATTCYLGIVGGTTAGLVNTAGLVIGQRDSGGAGLSSAGAPMLGTALQKLTALTTITNASVAYINPLIEFQASAGGAIDITLRFAAPQIETTGGATPFPTSFIPTFGTAATRARDICSSPLGSWFNAKSGTLFCDYYLNGVASVPATTQGAVLLTDGTLNNRVGLASSQGNQFFLYSVGGVSYATPADSGVGVTNIRRKVAISYSPDRRAGSANGRAVVSLATAAPPLTVNQINIGSYPDSSNRVNGYVRAVTYKNAAASDAQLQAMTA